MVVMGFASLRLQKAGEGDRGLIAGTGAGGLRLSGHRYRRTTVSVYALRRFDG